MTDTTLSDNASFGDTLPPHYAWNVWVFSIDVGLFHVAMSFFSSTTVLPSFITALGGSELVVGLAGGLMAGGWLLPQLFVASAVARSPRNKPLIMRGAWLGRPIFLVLALVVWLFGSRSPQLTLWFTLSSVFAFFLVDAVVSVPWFTFLGKAIPARRRGRVLGTAQVLGGLGGIAAGVVVRFVLHEGSPWSFPTNYAVLFGLGALLFLGNAVALSCLREPEAPPAGGDVPTVREVLVSLPGILAHDRPFLRLIVVRLLSGFVTLSSAFYVLHATSHLGFGPEATGLFVSSQVLGSLATGLVMGTLQDRWGPLVHIRAIIAASLLSPIIALCAEPALGVLGQGVLYLYLSVFFFLGVYAGSIGWPFFNWILEYAEETRRPLYIGAINTLGALVMLAPALGGWVVKAVSYPAAFLVAVAFAISALVLSFYLPSTR